MNSSLMRRTARTIGNSHCDLPSLELSLIWRCRYKGKVSGDKLTLSLWNKGGEEVAKNIQLQLTFI